MTTSTTPEATAFLFRDLHPGVSLGTASDRYAGWVGQIYSKDRYGGKITSRTKRLGGMSFREQVLPVESVREYFEHFALLELDFTFYGTLLDKDLNPTPVFHTLQRYRKHLPAGARLILKVPQVTFARRLWRNGHFTENPEYLDPDIFVHRFYRPAGEILEDRLQGLVFEQEYQPKKGRDSPGNLVRNLEAFLGSIPEDPRYHIEVRTEAFLGDDYFRVLEEHGVGQVLSHWTWLPTLRRQFARSGRRFLNGGGQCVVRLMTPLRVRYETAYETAFPFDRLVEGMLDPRMVADTVGILEEGITRGVHVNVVINNRAGGNAPLIAQKIVQEFRESGDAGS